MPHGNHALSLLVLCALSAPAQAQTVDLDHDGIDDAYEDLLLQQFAPHLAFAGTWIPPGSEQNYPSSVEWAFSRSEMRFTHKWCFDHEVLPHGVTVEDITERTHRNAERSWLECFHEGPDLYSDVHVSEDTKKGFFLDYNGAQQNAPQSQWVAYGHVFPSGWLAGGTEAEAYVVQYWYHFPYNDYFLRFNHEGDWEYVAAVVADDDGIAGPQQPYVHHYRLSQHGEDRRYETHELSSYGGTGRPLVYVAKGAHAMYPSYEFNAGCATYICSSSHSFYCWDKCDGSGIVWDTADTATFGGIVNVGEKYFPTAGSNWIRYTGRWGEIGEFRHTTGPQGPAVQSGSWHIDGKPEICGNGIDDNVDGAIDLYCEPMPDLWVVDGNPALSDNGVAGRPVVHPGEQLKVLCEIANYGSGISVDFDTKLYLSLDDQLGPEDIQLQGHLMMTGMPAHQTFGPLPTWTSTVPVTTPFQRYKVITFIDAGQDVLERDETNNVYVSETRVTVVPPGGLADSFDDGVTPAFQPLSGSWTPFGGMYRGEGWFAVSELDLGSAAEHVFEVDFMLDQLGPTGDFSTGLILGEASGSHVQVVLRSIAGFASWELHHYDAAGGDQVLAAGPIDENTDLTRDLHRVEVRDCPSGLRLFVDGIRHATVTQVPAFDRRYCALLVDLGAAVAFDNFLAYPATLDFDGDGWSVCGGDCNDVDPDAHPGLLEVCGNAVDEDCNGYVDEVCGDGLEVKLSVSGPAGAKFGDSVALLGDLNDDGLQEVAVGAPSFDQPVTDAGLVRILSGSDLSTLLSVPGDAAGLELGTALSSAGYLDGDEFVDVLAGCAGGGVARVYSGEWIVRTASGQTPTTSQILLSVAGSQTGERFGARVLGGLNMDDDGVPDFLVAAPLHSPSGLAQAGAVRAFSGADGSLHWEVVGTSANAKLGSSLAKIRPNNNYDTDGLQDYLVGVPGANQVLVISAPTGATLATLSWNGGISSPGFGTGIAVMGDTTGDLKDEFAVTAPFYDDSPGFGTTGVVLGYRSEGSNYPPLYGDYELAGLGFDIGATGDIDGDGRGDLCVAALGDRPNLVSGTDGAQIEKLPDTPGGDVYGLTRFRVVPGLDLEVDGLDDILAAIPSHDELVVYDTRGLVVPILVSAAWILGTPAGPRTRVTSVFSTFGLAGELVDLEVQADFGAGFVLAGTSSVLVPTSPPPQLEHVFVVNHPEAYSKTATYRYRARRILGGVPEAWSEVEIGHPAADRNKDGVVSLIDLGIWAGSLGKLPGDPDFNPLSDFNFSSTVDIVDLSIFWTQWPPAL